MATYYVTTDTHGYPWGESNVAQAHFDLGDNTPSYPATFQEAPHDPSGSNLIMRVLGNHDAAYYNNNSSPSKPNLQLQTTWTLNGVTICALGFNSATDQNQYNIAPADILTAFNYLESRPSGMHVMVLTHNPLFEPITRSGYQTGASYDQTDLNKWVTWGTDSDDNEITARTTLVDMLRAYRATSSSQKSFVLNGTTYTFTKNGYIIGCFCGHIHNHVKCRYRGIYMEAFGTNGASEWTDDGNQENAGLYTPATYTIELNPSTYTVNDVSYSSRTSSTTSPISTDNAYSGTGMGDGATGAVKFDYNASQYPKFRQSRYIGYSDSSSNGVTYINDNDGYWYVRGATLSGSGVSGTVDYIRFDASGRLRYYSHSGHADSDFHEISGYLTRTITFTANGYTWRFVNGLYNGYTAT